MMKRILSLIAFCVISFYVHAQSGVSLYSGLSFASSQDEVVTPSGQLHSGYFIGGDARMFADTPMFMMVGLQYHKIGILASESASVFPDQTMSILKGKAGLGFYLLNFKNLKLRLKAQGVMDYMLDYDSDLIKSNPTHNRINDAHLGASLGLGADFLFFTFDVDYEYGIINAYFEEPDSKFNYFSVAVGVFF